MKRIHLLLVIGLAFLAPQVAYAVVGCDGTNVCQSPGAPAPGNSALPAPAVTVGQINTIFIDNSSNASIPNATTAWYWFFATTTTPTCSNSGCVQFNPDGNGFRNYSFAKITDQLLGSYNDRFGSAKIFLRAGTAYNIYAQACVNGTAIPNQSGSTVCSDWKLAFSNVTTNVLPSSVFLAPIKSDVLSSSALQVRVDGTKVTVSDVQSASITLVNVDAGSIPAQVTISPYVSNTFNIDSSLYSFVPNTQYQYKGQLQYPFQYTNPETKGPFLYDPGGSRSDHSGSRLRDAFYRHLKLDEHFRSGR